jgi:hypothetical protein
MALVDHVRFYAQGWSMMGSRWGQLQLNHMARRGGRWFFKENWIVVTKNGVMVAGQICIIINK